MLTRKRHSTADCANNCIMHLETIQQRVNKSQQTMLSTITINRHNIINNIIDIITVNNIIFISLMCLLYLLHFVMQIKIHIITSTIKT